ncbi:T9SS C-terminal target domain-containing protein [bacterium]|nr:MAG: T9SS C-terminal target domain-containing protein [bacterium]
MFVVKLCFSLLFFINSIFLYALELPKHSSNNNRNTNPYVIAIMVEFEQDNSPFTSGDGLFLDSLNIQMISDPSLDRCNQFILDRPPHDVNYFSSQIEAVSNYYKSASNDNLNIQSQIILNPNNEKGYYRLNKIMESYSYSDRDLSALFKESLELAKDDIEIYLESNPDIDFEDIIFTVFHAGIGQDFSFPTFDPTVYDIKSAYLEPEMFDGLSFPIINNNQVSSGILLPETQNMIFFSSVEDIFYGEDSYCDYQLGMTGTFSFLMGYALGLPPLFNTETGDPGIGIFGLMDYGSNNGRGVIPSLPSPWTRILMNWNNSINLTSDASLTQSLVTNIMSEQIFRFDISDNEYYLIENKLNTFDDGLSIKDIVSNFNGPYEDGIFPDSYNNWFDAIIASNDTYDIFQFSEDSIITNIKNYDLGLPQSGILIWHIDEPNGNVNDGINNNPNNKAIAIEEADGALDIGFESYALFSNDDPTSGTKWDFWFKGNEAYHYANNIPYECYSPETYSIIEAGYSVECINSGGLWLKTEKFDSFSTPNSNINDNIKSFFSFDIIDSISNNTKVKIQYSSSIPYVDLSDNYEKILGTSNTRIYYGLDDRTIIDLNLDSFEYTNSFLGSYEDNSVILTNSINFSDIYNSNSEFIYIDSTDNLIEIDHELWFGYFLNNDGQRELQPFKYIDNKLIISENEYIIDYEPSTGVSIIDVNQDGLDEIVFVDISGQIIAYNANGTLVNGFPIGNDYHGVVLAVSDDTNDLVLICRNKTYIDFLWLNGDTISVPTQDEHSDLMIINDFLTDGTRFYELNSNQSFFNIGDISYWLQRYNNHSHFAKSFKNHSLIEYLSNDKIINSFYNYPNPIKDGKTKFRFFINEPTNKIEIKIYNISGNLIDSFSEYNLSVYQYNEIEWQTNRLMPGLYYAEILASNKQQKIIKVVIGH